MMNSVSVSKKPTQTIVNPWRKNFPILAQQAHGKPLVYLDSAATSQKPQVVIDALQDYYTHNNANVHRGLHMLSERATAHYENARETARQFINANSSKEIIFTKGATEAINLVAQSYGRSQLQAGDEIIISTMEHHSNIVPWQLICEQTGAKLKVIPINDQGEIIITEYYRLLSMRTKLVAIVHVSNSLGTINPVDEIIEAAHAQKVPVLLDGAQSTVHSKIDVQQLDCDFFAISGHKLYGPTGIGILYGKEKWLEKLPPYQGGGEMIKQVTFNKTTFNHLPNKFEAGTPPIAGAIGLAAAMRYLEAIGMSKIAKHEQQLLQYAIKQAEDFPGLRLIGTAKNKAAILSFILDGIHAHDIGTIIDNEGVAIRAGHHCTMPVMQFFNIAATARASLALYNTFEDIDKLFQALNQVKRIFEQ